MADMAKKTTAQKEPVKLREKKLANGNVSLYLDIYRNGKRHKEYLKLYLIDAKTYVEKEQNRQTLATAQAIKSKRMIEIQNGEYSFTHQFKEDTPFLEYYRKMVEERRKYNPQNEMFATFQTKRYFIQNETSSKKIIFQSIQEAVKKHWKILFLPVLFSLNSVGYVS